MPRFSAVCGESYKAGIRAPLLFVRAHADVQDVRRFVSASVVLMLLLLPGVAIAGPAGSLDPGFGDHGAVALPSEVRGGLMERLSDGRTMHIARATDSSNRLSVSVVDRSGAVKSSVLDIPGATSQAGVIGIEALIDGGAIVVVDRGSSALLIRLSATASPVGGFGTSGFVDLGANRSVRVVPSESDDSLLVLRSSDGESTSFEKLDARTGAVIATCAGASIPYWVAAMQVDSSGRIAGSIYRYGVAGGYVRMHADCSLDASFGEGGVVSPQQSTSPGAPAVDGISRILPRRGGGYVAVGISGVSSASGRWSQDSALVVVLSESGSELSRRVWSAGNDEFYRPSDGDPLLDLPLDAEFDDLTRLDDGRLVATGYRELTPGGDRAPLASVMRSDGAVDEGFARSVVSPEFAAGPDVDAAGTSIGVLDRRGSVARLRLDGVSDTAPPTLAISSWIRAHRAVVYGRDHDGRRRRLNIRFTNPGRHVVRWRSDDPDARSRIRQRLTKARATSLIVRPSKPGCTSVQMVDARGLRSQWANYCALAPYPELARIGGTRALRFSGRWRSVRGRQFTGRQAMVGYAGARVVGDVSRWRSDRAWLLVRTCPRCGSIEIKQRTSRLRVALRTRRPSMRRIALRAESLELRATGRGPVVVDGVYVLPSDSVDLL